MLRVMAETHTHRDNIRTHKRRPIPGQSCLTGTYRIEIMPVEFVLKMVGIHSVGFQLSDPIGSAQNPARDPTERIAWPGSCKVLIDYDKPFQNLVDPSSP